MSHCLNEPQIIRKINTGATGVSTTRRTLHDMLMASPETPPKLQLCRPMSSPPKLLHKLSTGTGENLARFWGPTNFPQVHSF